MRAPRFVIPLTLVALALTWAPRVFANGGTTYEIYTDRTAFETRLGSAPTVIDFDDIDTSKNDPVPFAAKRYKYSHGATITGEDGQFASTEFDPASNMPPSSAPNEYAPGPVSDLLGGGGNTTDIHFFQGLRPALVAAVGVVFIDADFPGDGPSTLAVFDEVGTQLAITPTVSGSDGSQEFRGIIAIETGPNDPTPKIFRAHIVSGEGWAGNFDNETVALDDLCFSTPQVLPGNTGEICGNCVDDDGDDRVDRHDEECTPFASGTNLGDPKGPNKAAVKCQKNLTKAAGKFVLTKIKRLTKCLQAVSKCVQEKGGAPDCIDKAAVKCGKEVAKIPADEAKLAEKVVGSCEALSIADLKSGDGLGFGVDEKECSTYTGGGLANVGEVATCVVGEQECRAERLLGRVVPRAFEYLTLAGLNVPTLFPCLPMGADGGGMGLADAKIAKALGKCDKEIQKALLALLKESAKIGQKCGDAAAKCQQQKPDDPKCLPKATTKCEKLVDKLLDFQKGKATKILTKTLKKCDIDALTHADLTDAIGLGYTAADTRCSELGLGTGSPFAILNCLGGDIFCEAIRMGEKQSPRLRQQADVLGISLPDELL